MIDLTWSPRSVADLEEIRAFIEVDSPSWADLTVRRLVAAVERLRQFPDSESEKANLMVGQAEGPIDRSQQAILFYLYFENIKETRAALMGLGHQPGELTYPFYMPGGECRLEDPDGSS